MNAHQPPNKHFINYQSRSCSLFSEVDLAGFHFVFLYFLFIFTDLGSVTRQNSNK